MESGSALAPRSTDGTDSRRRAQDLLVQHGADVRRFLEFLLPAADADDVAQDLAVCVLERPELVLQCGQPGAYLRGIARHLASRHRRRYPRHALIEDLVLETWDDQAAAQAPGDRLALAACTRQLAERTRRMLDLRYREGLDAEAIAAQVSLTPSGVRMALKRSRELLMRCLRQRQSEGDADA